MITITTINNSYYFIGNLVIQPNSSAVVDETILSYQKLRDIVLAEQNKRITLSNTDLNAVKSEMNAKDGKIDESSFKTINGESIIGSGDLEINSQDFSSDLESACHIEGGDITITGGTTFNISAGYGYARDPSGKLVKVTWTENTSLQTVYNGANYVGLDYNGDVVFSNDLLGPTYIPCGYIFTTNNNTAVIGFANVRLTGKDSLYRLGDLFRNTIGTLVESGVSTAMKPAPEELQLVISQGTIWYLLNKYEISQTDQFTKLYQNAEGFGVDTSNPNTINFMDYSDVSLSGNSLINMSVGYYKKDMVVVTPSNKAYYIYATTQWPTIEEAKEAPLPDVPDSIRNSVVRSAALIIEQSTLGVIEVLDIRPMFTKLFETGSAASNATVISHSDLTDLSNDDHTQYHNDTRGDIRYYRKSEVDALVNSKADLNHTHTNANYGNHPNNPYFSFMEHFIGTSATSTVSPYFLRTVNSGTTAAVSLSSDTDTRMGVLRLGTGFYNTSGAALGTSGMQSFNFAAIPNGGYYETGCSFQLPTLSDATETFSLVFGFGDATTAQPIDGVFLRYTTDTVVGRLVVESVITNIAIPNITNLEINTDYILKIRVSRDNSGVLSATFKLNGNEVTTSSGIPTGVARQTTLQYAIIKSSGINSRFVELDWIYFERYFPEISNY